LVYVRDTSSHEQGDLTKAIQKLAMQRNLQDGHENGRRMRGVQLGSLLHAVCSWGSDQAQARDGDRTTDSSKDIVRQQIQSHVQGLEHRAYADLHGANLKVLMGGVEPLDDSIHQCISLEVHVSAHQLEEEGHKDHLERDLTQIRHEHLDTSWLNLLHA
jgi:hypothetical protein